MLIFLGVGIILGAMTFRLGRNADWHWAAALVVALVPIGFTFFMGILGLLISAVFVGSLYKATA